MEIIKYNYQAYPGHKYPPLFFMIPLTHWVPDELHLMLCITVQFWSLMLSETKYQSSDQIREQIKKEMIRIGVYFKSGKVQIQGVGIIPVLWPYKILQQIQLFSKVKQNYG
nr:4816_t:CDS:2 [Entrophospora candida]